MLLSDGHPANISIFVWVSYYIICIPFYEQYIYICIYIHRETKVYPRTANHIIFILHQRLFAALIVRTLLCRLKFVRPNSVETLYVWRWNTARHIMAQFTWTNFVCCKKWRGTSPAKTLQCSHSQPCDLSINKQVDHAPQHFNNFLLPYKVWIISSNWCPQILRNMSNHHSKTESRIDTCCQTSRSSLNSENFHWKWLSLRKEPTKHIPSGKLT